MNAGLAGFGDAVAGRLYELRSVLAPLIGLDLNPRIWAEEDRLDKLLVKE